MEKITVAFPGLGIEPFDLNKIAFHLFGKNEVRWYGIVITCGIFFAFLYAMWRGKRNEGIISDDVLDVGLMTVFMGVLGARLYYVLTTMDEYEYDSFVDVIAIWEGGLAIYGGIIGGCLGILLVCYFKKLRWQKLFDMIVAVSNQASLRITTGMLNSVLEDAQTRVQPPTDKGRRLKIYYMTQVGIRPPHFVIFCNDARLFHFSYQRYLENCLRNTFGLTGTPIVLTIRQKGEKEE